MTPALDDFGLQDLPTGTAGFVQGVEGDDPLAQRLWDMGFWPGTYVEAVRRAPFGGPTQYRMRGYRLALRQDEAARIRVRPES